VVRIHYTLGKIDRTLDGFHYCFKCAFSVSTELGIATLIIFYFREESSHPGT
jgi:hypothetical protein